MRILENVHYGRICRPPRRFGTVVSTTVCRLDQSHHLRVAVGFGQGHEILARHRIGFGAAGLYAVMGKKRLTGEVWRQAVNLADPQIDRRLAEIHRHKLAVDVGEMQKSDLAELSMGELVDELKATKQEALNLRFRNATGQLENTAEIGKVRKQIARINTLIRSKEIAAAEAGQ